MRHVAGGRREHADVGKVLPRGDALHSFRHRSRVSLSVGGGLSEDAQDGSRHDRRLDDFVPGHFVCRLHLRAEKEGFRLEMTKPAVIKFGTSGWRGLIARDFTFENVRLATQGIALYLKGELAQVSLSPSGGEGR